MTPMDEDSRPAKQLEGKELDGNWKVIRRIGKKPNATGGHFSTGYEVLNADGRRGFLKAVDYYEAFNSDDTMRVIASLSTAFNFERDLCFRCRSRNLANVVHAIDHGQIQTDPIDLFSKVSYLIFELADGDIRHHLDTQEKFDAAFMLRTLHHVTIGLNQLHKIDVAHQDLKPSNVLVFEQEGISKVADLGRAWADGMPAPHDQHAVAGQISYAPPEQRYGFLDPDQRRRRFACDLYHLGSLAVFFFTRVHLNSLIQQNLGGIKVSSSFGGTFLEAVPYLQAALGTTLEQICLQFPELVRTEMVAAVAQLCEPDPSKRGHPEDQRSNQFSLERYISLFKLLAHRVETAYLKGSI